MTKTDYNNLVFYMLTFFSSIIIIRRFVPSSAFIIQDRILLISLVVMFLCLFSLITNKEAEAYFFRVALPVFSVELFLQGRLYLTGKGIQYQQIIELLTFFAFIVLSLYITINSNQKRIRQLCNIVLGVTIGSMVFTSMTTYTGNIIYPQASRLLAVSGEEYSDLFLLYKKLNIGGFDFIYTITLLTPLIVYWMKRGKKSLISGIILLFTFIRCIIETQYTIALIVSTIPLCLVLLPRRVKLNSIIVVSFLGVVMFMMFAPLLSDILSSSSESEERSILSGRLDDLSNFYSSGGNSMKGSDIDLRQASWERSIYNFIESPILGSCDSSGGHSYLLDKLSMFGLLGLVLLAVEFYYIYKRFVWVYRKHEIYKYALCCYFMNMFQCLVNTYNAHIIFVLIIPLLAVLTSPSYKYEASKQRPISGFETENTGHFNH